ncbi:unnamed protein product [Chironomus riparius]|uniref:Uncharacterized protein n=1 Tax=Chironomus riparius TaxID=315576 RepID=A0A9N9WVC1_9DIPT|nr:unnamed protein product [Chironomus riparius]
MNDSAVLFLAIFQLLFLACCFYLCIKSCAIINCLNGFCNFFGKYDKEEETQGHSGQSAVNHSYFMPTIEHPTLPLECKMENCNSHPCHHNFFPKCSSTDVAINVSGEALLESEL